MLALCRQYPGYCYPMMGLHPTDVGEDYRQVLEDMHQYLLQPGNPYIAIGEVGLDFYWDDTLRQEQTEAFETQISWARDLHLPLMIHSRSAHRELVDIMNGHQSEGLTGVFHCFGGTLEEALQLLRYEGFNLGIGGVLTYKKSTLPDVLREIPLQRVVLETDCPYLSPVPHRGQRNESSYLIHTARKMSEVLNLPVEEIMEVTTCNARRVFPAINVS